MPPATGPALLSDILTYVATRVSRPKIAIGAAWREGRLPLWADVREHRSEPTDAKVELIRPISTELPPRYIPSKLDWDNSRQTYRDLKTPASLFERANIRGRWEQVLALWPPPDAPAERAKGPVEWLAVETKRLKSIPNHPAQRTAVAQLLKPRMDAAHSRGECTNTLAVGTIVNYLRDHLLWP